MNKLYNRAKNMGLVYLYTYIYISIYLYIYTGNIYIHVYAVYIIRIHPSYSKHVNHLQFYRFTIGYTPTELLGTGTGSANHQVMLVDIGGFCMAPLTSHSD
jgi:hypothetical protein